MRTVTLECLSNFCSYSIGDNSDSMKNFIFDRNSFFSHFKGENYFAPCATKFIIL